MEPEVQQGQAQQGQEDLLAQVVKLLQQGMSPEELLKMGVPQEILEQAIAMVQQSQSGAGAQPTAQQSPQQRPAGLADMYARGGM